MLSGWRLERTFLTGAGQAESRLEGLDITWSDPDQATHAALWADNGTGKTMITALRFALYLPGVFIRGDSDRNLASLVTTGDVCHVVEQATRVVDGEVQRIVAGMIASWPDPGTQDLDNPGRLRRLFYGWLPGPDEPTIDDLPFRTDAGRWASAAQYLTSLRQLLPDGSTVPPHAPSEHHGRWREWLQGGAGIDVEQVKIQTEMNASEGGIDQVMKFTDSDAFIRWLIGATMPATTVAQITGSIHTLRANALARPRWQEELSLWDRIIEPLLNLAVAHEDAGRDRNLALSARSRAAQVAADGHATVAAQQARQETAAQRQDHHAGRRRDAGAMQRRAQAHRLRMQLRSAELKVQLAEQRASQRLIERDDAADALSAWLLVNDVLDSRATTTTLASLEETRDAAEKETTELRRDETRHRDALARLLTHQRDQAAQAHETAVAALAATKRQYQTARDELSACIAAQAAAAERARSLGLEITRAEQILAAAIADGLLPEGTPPAEHDEELVTQLASARADRTRISTTLAAIGPDLDAATHAQHTHASQASAARGEQQRAEEQLAAIAGQLASLTANEHLLDAAGTVGDVWLERPRLADALSEHADHADRQAAQAAITAAHAQRTIDSVGHDRLLPPSPLVENVLALCLELDLPAWSGWRWLADTMNADRASVFATARPDIASGVVVPAPELVEPVVAAIADLELDQALWIGAVTDPREAASVSPGRPSAGTEAVILLPPAGTYDREATDLMVETASATLNNAQQNQHTAQQQARQTREALAALEAVWREFPHDPRPGLRSRIDTAQRRLTDALAAEETARTLGQELVGRRLELQTQLTELNNLLGMLQDARLSLAPAIAASAALSNARTDLPGTRGEVAELQDRIDLLNTDWPRLDNLLEKLNTDTTRAAQNRDDATEALRHEGLTANSRGPVPSDDQQTIRARLDSVTDALTHAAIDPALHDQILQTRHHLSDLSARLTANPAIRVLAEQYADTPHARHQIALTAQIETARHEEATARSTAALADAAAQNARAEYRTRSEDHSDRTSPDVDAIPASHTITSPIDADRHARILDDQASQLGETARQEERLTKEAETAAREAEQAVKLISTTVKPLRYLADHSLTGTATDDVDHLIDDLNEVTENVQTATQRLASSEHAVQNTANQVRSHANSAMARKVEEGDDIHLGDLIQRLRADDELPHDAERLAGQLEQRAASLRDDLANHDKQVRICASMLHVQAATAIQRLRSYQNQSTLPDGLGDWSNQKFVLIEHPAVPADESVSIDRVARVVHNLLSTGERSDAKQMLFAAARALIDAPFQVRLLKPHIDLALDRVNVSQLSNFSGGQRVTAGVLLYATMTRVRANHNPSIGWLWLDNPFGQASADQFVRTMRLAADKLGLQLVFTAAPKDQGALSMFDRVIALARRSRPASGERVIVISKRTSEVAELSLIQNDVMTVLGT